MTPAASQRQDAALSCNKKQHAHGSYSSNKIVKLDS